nr:cellulose biosynthesis protein BcsG [Xylophilus sp. ASV27]
MLHVCSLSWDDLDVVGMRNHPLLRRFDAVFTQFNSAASYSGPAMLRVLRGNCGQQPHKALYEGTDPSCYVFHSLERLGYKTHALLNHDGHFDQFLTDLECVGRPVVVLLVPEHGAALRGDKLQISGMREIPSPRITLVPAAMKIVGLPAGAGSGPVVVDQPVSYFGLNALLGDMLRDSPFTPGSRPLAERMAHLETTAFASENGDMLVMRDAAGQYRMRTDKGVWVPYNP